MRIQRVAQRSGDVTELLLDAAGKRLAVGDDAGLVTLWDLERAGEPIGYIEGALDNIDAMDWLPDRSGFVAAGSNGIGAWSFDETETGSWPELHTPQSVAVIDEHRALVACQGNLVLVDFAAGRVLSETPVGERNTGIARHPGGRGFAISSCDQGGSQVLWAEVDGDVVRVREQPLLERDVDHLTRPAIDSSGDLVMVADHRLSVFEMRGGARVAGYDADGKKTKLRLGDGLLVERFWTQCVALGDGKLASASPDGVVIVYDVASKSVELREGLPRPATALTADGAALAAASMDWSIVLWWP